MGTDGDGAGMVNRPPRRGSTAVRLELGLFAFAPALGLMAFKSRHQSWWWVCFALPAVLGCVVSVVAAVVVRRASAEPYTFADIEDMGDDVLGHVSSYLLTVIVSASASFEEFVIAGIALALIVQIHVASGRVHVNPLLYLSGYRTYRASTDTGVHYYLIAHSDPALWLSVRHCVPLGGSVLVERRGDAVDPSRG